MKHERENNLRGSDKESDETSRVLIATDNISTVILLLLATKRREVRKRKHTFSTWKPIDLNALKAAIWTGQVED